TLGSDRYFYPLLPPYYLLSSYALLMALRMLGTFALTRLSPSLVSYGAFTVPGEYHARILHICIGITAGLCYLCVLLFPLLPLTNSSLFLSRAGHVTYYRHTLDYDVVGRYIQQHRHPGDVVISVGPPLALSYYAGQIDYCLLSDQAQSLVEQHLAIIDEYTGVPVLLSQGDLQSVLATSKRIWLISDSGPFPAELAGNEQFHFPAGLHLAYEGYGTAIYQYGK
ncbi:MAG TPA: hypothetical protein VFN23_16895, partial [Ktedonobacteraceae bacterium]|nr:hypothetical protein [Ktedonobacteraceae bacterium]